MRPDRRLQQKEDPFIADDLEQNVFRTEMEQIFSTNGLPPSLMKYLYVLDKTPWYDKVHSI